MVVEAVEQSEGDSVNIQNLCADVIAKARQYVKAFNFRTEPSIGAAEFWNNYRKRLATYDNEFQYPDGINPAKCAIKGWIYLVEGKIQCVECNKEIQLSDESFIDRLKNLRNKHDPLCSFQAAFHHAIILHSVRELLPHFDTHIQPQPFKSEEISDKLANLSHIAEIQPSFSLFFATAGWFVKKDKTLFCKLCIKNVDLSEHRNELVDPLKLHHNYCPILESYPQWKLALEEYAHANSNPRSISENFALIQRQLAATGLQTKVQTPAVVEEDEEISSIHEETGMIDANRTLKSLQEAHNQTVEMFESPQQPRDTDFEAEFRQESQNRKRLREEDADEDGPSSAKRSFLPFPHNYLREYNQPIGNVQPIVAPVNVSPTIVVPVDQQTPGTLDISDTSIQGRESLSASSFEEMPGSNESLLIQDDEMEETANENEILSPEELDRLPLHEGGEREEEDSDDVQSAEPESYEDDEATTDEESVDEMAPYNEPEEFKEYDSNDEEEIPAEQPDNAVNLEGNEQSETQSNEAVEDEEDEYSENENPEEPEEFEDYSGSDQNDGDSDIIVLD